ncbi:MAG: hypothetical protein KatS3mg088_355 [Patescibacteria group bacterium]|nr:MAG: hypothetical protein KatS3mg088_355 [Patescibacteria group bacterium]
MEGKEQLSNQTNPREIAKQYGINESILTIIDNGSLENWNGIKRLPDEIKSAFPDKINEETYKKLITGNVLAAAARLSKGGLKIPEPAIDNRNFNNEDKSSILRMAVFMFSYPRGIRPNNTNVSLVINEDDIDTLEKILNLLVPPDSTIEKELKKMLFSFQNGSYSLRFTQKNLQNS